MPSTGKNMAQSSCSYKLQKNVLQARNETIYVELTNCQVFLLN